MKTTGNNFHIFLNFIFYLDFINGIAAGTILPDYKSPKIFRKIEIPNAVDINPE